MASKSSVIMRASQGTLEVTGTIIKNFWQAAFLYFLILSKNERLNHDCLHFSKFKKPDTKHVWPITLLTNHHYKCLLRSIIKCYKYGKVETLLFSKFCIVKSVGAGNIFGISGLPAINCFPVGLWKPMSERSVTSCDVIASWKCDVSPKSTGRACVSLVSVKCILPEEEMTSSGDDSIYTICFSPECGTLGLVSFAVRFIFVPAPLHCVVTFDTVATIDEFWKAAIRFSLMRFNVELEYL